MNAVHLRVIAGDEHYALPVSSVLGITQLGEVTAVPGAAPELLGVRNLRGAVIPLIDLAAVLGLDGGHVLEWIVVCESRGGRCGLALAETLDVGEIPGADDDVEAPFLSGIALVDGDLVGIVDVDAIFDSLSPAVPA